MGSLGVFSQFFKCLDGDYVVSYIEGTHSHKALTYVDFRRDELGRFYVGRQSKNGNWFVNRNYEIKKLFKMMIESAQSSWFYRVIYMKNSQAWYVFYRSSTGS